MSIPLVPFENFYTSLSTFVNNDGYVVQFFAYAEEGRTYLLAVLRNRDLYVISTEVGSMFQSLTARVSEKFHMFEREIAEQYGVLPDGHPWLKMVRYP